MRTLYARNGRATCRVMVFVGLCAAVTAMGCTTVMANLGPKLQRHDQKRQVALPKDACALDEPKECSQKCSAGYARSCNTLAVMNEYGLHDAPDYTRAARFYRTSCAGDYAQGCTNLGWMYALGRGVGRDRRLAVVLFTKAFQGYRLACLRGEIDGCLLAVGHLREGLVQKDNERLELALLRRACELGHEGSCREAPTP